jgi:NitT/TauT family transport system substrate-binding protein
MLALFTLVVALAACGSSSSDSSASSGGSGSMPSGSDSAASDSGKLTKLKVGVLPISAMAPLYLGQERGIFARHGLDIEPVVAQSGAAIVPAVLSGDQQFGFANVVSLMVARDKGLPMKIVAQGSSSGPGPSQRFEAVIVKGDSPIRSPRDLEGKTMSVNALNDIGGVVISAALQKLGVDTRTIRFVEIGFPDANAALDAGRIDAAYQGEPFLRQALDSGDRAVLYQDPVLGRQVAVADYFTSEQEQQQNPDVVRAFRAAMDESLEYANAHEDEAREITTRITSVPESIAQRMVMPGWDPNLDPDTSGLSLVGDLALRAGLIRRAPDYSTMFAN